jgi:hypothetical protein
MHSRSRGRYFFSWPYLCILGWIGGGGGAGVGEDKKKICMKVDVRGSVKCTSLGLSPDCIHTSYIVDGAFSFSRWS